MLLHLQLSLSLDRDRLPRSLLLASLLESLSALLHALSKASWRSWLLHIQQWRGVRSVGDLAVGVGALLNSEGSSVCPVLNLLLRCLKASREALCVVHWDWRWWRIERLITALHDVLWKWNGVVVAWHAIQVCNIGLRVYGCAKLVGLGVPGGLLEALNGAVHRVKNILNTVSARALGEDLSERIVCNGFWERRSDGDWAMEGEE